MGVNIFIKHYTGHLNISIQHYIHHRVRGCGEQVAEGHHAEQGHQGGVGGGEAVLPAASRLQAHGRQDGHRVPAEETQ